MLYANKVFYLLCEYFVDNFFQIPLKLSKVSKNVKAATYLKKKYMSIYL